jgi:sulfide:quinone oxidoreductase
VHAAERSRVLVAGGGVAALEGVLALQEVAPDLDLTLLSASPRWEYVPLSVAEPFGLGLAHRFELAEILEDRGVEIVIDTLESIDAERREARTAAGRTLAYGALLVAVGARRQSALPGAVTFSGASSSGEIRALLGDAGSGAVERLAFAVPSGVTWSLPIYELALMTSAQFAEQEIRTSVALVTPEPRPVDVFGERSSSAVGEMLQMRGIAFHSAAPLRAESGRLIVEDGEPIPADVVVALPRLLAPQVGGLPEGERGFVPVDEHGRVPGAPGVYAAGDATTFPLKQGGLAAQQADAAAEAIAADLGEDLRPQPFRPSLRGLLLTGRAPRYLRAEVIRNREQPVPPAGRGEIWWPPAKIAGRRLGPLLARHGTAGGTPPGAVALELDAPEIPADSRLTD